MILRSIFAILLMIGLSQQAQSQAITLDYDDEPLNEVLLDLNTRFEVPVSIDANLSSQCLISIDENFASIEMALEAIADFCQLQLALVNGVYSFQSDVSSGESVAEVLQQYIYQGIVKDIHTLEPIPFSTLRLGTSHIIANSEGIFSIKSTQKSLSTVANSLGYARVDTLVTPGNGIIIFMTQTALALDEVVVLEHPEEEVTHIGAYAGHLKLNDVSNHLIPGQNINAVFNNIKMYPGITSSGESLSDYLIWGSYSGQNLTLFDDITIFNSWGINDDIGRINPLMVRNIEVYKGGYEATYGDRVGGLILIDGKQGNAKEPSGEINLSNQLAMMHLGIPLFKGSSVLQVAGRQSYFDIMDWSLEQERPNNGAIIPQYQFQDLNIKWNTHFSNGDQLQLSVIHSQDEYEGVQSVPENRRLERNIKVGSDQTGFSAKYMKQWENVGFSTLTYAQSQFNPEVQINFLSAEATEDRLRSILWLNGIEERSLKLEHQFPLSRDFQWNIGVGAIENQSTLQTPADILSTTENETLLRSYGYLQGNWQVAPKLLLKASARGDVVNSKLFFQPRLSTIIDLTSKWSVNASWGKYHQFISHVPVLDYLGNNSNFWQVYDPGDVDPELAYHHILGTTFKPLRQLEFNLTGYYIQQENGKSLSIDQNRNARLLTRQSQSAGFDVFGKFIVGSQQLIMAYSLNQTLERFGLNAINDSRPYREAPQSQRHEIKATFISNIGPLKASFSSVYGSGFPIAAPVRSEDLARLNRANPNLRIERRVRYEPYWRTDAAIEYPWKTGKLDWAMGTSVINIFNHRNIRLNQSLVVPDNSTINTLGEPFTLTAYLKLGF